MTATYVHGVRLSSPRPPVTLADIRARAEQMRTMRVPRPVRPRHRRSWWRSAFRAVRVALADATFSIAATAERLGATIGAPL